VLILAAMIRRLKIRNFRSILDSELSLSPTGMTAIVGANGSGKSNLIKLLEFVGRIARNGLESAVRSGGGMMSLLPKKLTASQLRSAALEIEYELDLPSQEGQPISGGSIRHLFSLVNPVRPDPHLHREELTFSKVTVKSRVPSQADVTLEEVKLVQVDSGRVTFSVKPEITPENQSSFLFWLGLPGLLVQDNVLDVLAERLSDPPTGATSRRFARESLVAGQNDILGLTFSPVARSLTSYLRNIRRYDLQLAQLRRSQEFSESGDLGTDGLGMPSALQKLRSSSESQRWKEVGEVLRDIAPHFLDATRSQFSSGHEFLQFFERGTGRPVESWHASDGTLRALAILVALETTPTSSVVMVEEPEMGLHPWAIRTLVAHCRATVANRGIQLIVSTHSQQVLDELEASEIRVATRSPEAGTRFHGIHEFVDITEVSRGDIGRLWVSGLLGGVPSPRE
jgi:predicted ATPase